MYKEAIAKPFENIDKLWPIMVVMIINMIIVSVFRRFYFDYGVLIAFIITSFISIIPLSYYLKSIDIKHYKKNKLPEWENLLDMFYKGLIAFLSIVLCILPLVVLIILSELLTTYIYIASAIYAGILIYLLPGMLANYAKEYKFSDFFNFSYIISKAATITYISAFFFGVIWFILLNIFVFIPYLGALFFLFTKPASMLTCLTLISKAINKDEYYDI